MLFRSPAWGWVHNPNPMPEHIQLQVFQRSFSTKEPGRGLGTYAMRLLSERYLEGAVGFTSNEEQGTTFWARYPVQPKYYQGLLFPKSQQTED